MPDPQALVHSIGNFSYGGIFVLALLANVVIPIPEEIILLTIGYVSSLGFVQLFLVIPIVIIGSLTSDITVHKLARGNNKYLKKIYNRFKESKAGKNEDFFRAHIKKTIFGFRFVTYLRFVGPVLSGFIKTPTKTFILYDFLALCIYIPFFILIGYFFHSKILFIIVGVQVLNHYVFIGVIILIVGLLFWYLNKKVFEKIDSEFINTPDLNK